jgi:glycerate 2-kinase
MKILISPDSFKGTMSSVKAAAVMERALKEAIPTALTVCLPVADGGEGTLEAFITATNGHTIEVQVHDPLGRDITAKYGVLGDGETCVIEMAQASGITLLKKDERNPFKATTFGTGQLIEHALNEGYRKFIIGIGGSATNDAGIGMLHALGIKLFDQNGQQLPNEVSSLQHVKKIDTTFMNSAIAQSTFTVACDVDNPFIGANGATAIFGPQKGVKPFEVKTLDGYFKHFADVIEKQYGIALHTFPGAGAAGGVGGALRAFFPVQFKQGIEVVLDSLRYEQHLQDADLVITGEGKSDLQTLCGKAPFGIAEQANRWNVPTILLSGMVDEEAIDELQKTFKYVISVVGEDIMAEESLRYPMESLQKRAVQAFKQII